MSDILSPEEISALLNTYNNAQSLDKDSGTGAQKRQIRSYDFTRPNRFSREQIKAINVIHRQFAAGLSTALTGLLNINIEADLLSVDQITYQEYCDSLPESTIFYGIALEPLTITAIIELNPSVAEACIDGLTGGTGTVSSQVLELSEIDRSILTSVVEIMLKKYEEAWASHVALKSKVQAEGNSLSADHMLLAAEQVVVINFGIKAGQADSMMSICIPAADTAKALPEDKIKSPVNTAPMQVPTRSVLLDDSLSDVAIESKAILGRTSLAMSDIINLQIGDIIKLDAGTDAQVELWLGDKPAYEGVAGLTGRNVGVKITRALTQETSHQS